MNQAGAISFCIALLCAVEARAIAPRYVSDEVLAQSPIIVVAKWEKAAFESHNKYREGEDLGPVVIRSEAYTKLRILRTIKGPKLTKGEYDLKVGRGISWSKDGTRLSSGTSTDLSGDVQDITKPSLWVLKRTKSWDENKKGEFLSVDNYRQIQPLGLEGYFLALGSDQPDTEVPRLLTPEKPGVGVRVLRYICGGIWPWPYESDRFGMRYANPETRGNVLRKEAESVWGLVNSEAEKNRPYAVSVYAELKGPDCVKDIRTLLTDKNPSVRGVAVGILVRHRDTSSLSEIQAAVQGVDEGWLACELIEELSSWGDVHIVPSLITYLQNSQFAYQYGDDLGIPALKARQALKKITGHWFPLDVARSLEVWGEAAQVTDKAERRALLEKLIPGKESSFLAELIGEPVYGEVERPETPAIRSSLRAGSPDDSAGEEREVSAKVRIRNITETPQMIARRPSGVTMSWPAGSSSSGGGFSEEEVKKDEFTTLESWGSFEFSVKLNQSFFIADPNTRSLKIAYHNNGNSIGLNAWIGTLEVKRGPVWKETRETKQVEETWPNGNLKTSGMTVNGHKFGEWNYFNEQGDRIKIVYYGEGRGTATCNPEHPSNKGAGKRPRRTQKPNKAMDSD